jgi:hypothetical protein
MEENKKQKEEIFCPNANPVIGGLILGVVNDKGQTTILPEPEIVDKEFYETVIKDADLEMKFRFSHPCVKGKCGHWQEGHGCDVPATVMNRVEEKMIQEGLMPECSIRSFCRWYTQEGPKACSLCPLVVNFTNDVKANESGEEL